MRPSGLGDQIHGVVFSVVLEMLYYLIGRILFLDMRQLKQSDS